MFGCTVKYSDRLTIGLEITEKSRLIVRAPHGTKDEEIERVILRHSSFIERAMKRQSERQKRHPEPDIEKARKLRDAARKYLPQRAEYFAEIMNVRYSGIKITSARRRFGSCNHKNGICFSWRLMMYPPEAVDYVVVHELAHTVHKNHGSEFYRLVASVLPDYRERRKELM